MSSIDIPATSGIYRITCTANGRFYIGSAVNLQRRWRVHQHYLSHGTHQNQHLQRAFDKHGSESIVFEIVEFILPAFLLEREQYYLDKLQPFGKKGFNIDRVAGSRMGHECSAATREKLRLANFGKTYGEETRRIHSEQGRARTHRQESKELIRLARLGTKRSVETCERLSISHLGIKQSAEHIENRRQASLGHEVSQTTRDKLSSKMSDAKDASKKTLIVISPDGVEQTIHGVGKFCKEHGLNHSALIQVAKGKHPHHKRWTARYP